MTGLTPGPVVGSHAKGPTITALLVQSRTPRPDKQDVMAKPTADSIAAELTVPERILLVLTE